MASDSEVFYITRTIFCYALDHNNNEQCTQIIFFHIQAGPSEKRIKHDTVQSADVRTLNNRFPKIDNLEYFPLKVLLQIFTAVSDIDLLSLAVNSSRFEKIAKVVLLERYADEYFTIDNITYGSSQTYEDFIQVFGSEIKSLEAKNTQGDEHWIQSLLNRMNHLVKLNWI